MTPTMMTTEELEALGHRAVACKSWRWNSTFRLRSIRLPPAEGCPTSRKHVDIPDLSDPATLGCLLALVREVHGDPTLSLLPIDESIPTRWEWCDDGLAAPALLRGIYDVPFPSEAEALVAALEAAPCST